MIKRMYGRWFRPSMGNDMVTMQWYVNLEEPKDSPRRQN